MSEAAELGHRRTVWLVGQIKKNYGEKTENIDAKIIVGS